MDSIQLSIESRLRELRASSISASQSQFTVKEKVRKLLKYEIEDKDMNTTQILTNTKNFVNIYLNGIEQKIFTMLVDSTDFHMDNKNFLIQQIKRILEYHRDYFQSYWVSKDLTFELTTIISYANVSNVLYNDYVKLKAELKKLGII